ncbi:MAG: hypothetical protein ACREOM_11445 [Candidatus Dormibacteraceae bacterium]
MIKIFHSTLLIHDHVHPYGRSQPRLVIGSTWVVNAVPSRLIEI